MRFNPDTERALNLEEIATQCKNAVISAAPSEQPAMKYQWDCQLGGWFRNPEVSY